MATREPVGAASGRRPERTTRRRPDRAPEGRRLDMATFFGLLCGGSLLLTAMVLGGSPTAFIDLPAFLIVIGGTFAVTTLCFSFNEIMRSQRVILTTLFYQGTQPREAALRVLRLADVARREGVLTLQSGIDSLRHTPFLHKSMGLVVDGIPGDEVTRILDNEIAAIRMRHAKGASVLRKAAEVSPAMGLIGTLIGLVQMLGRLDDPSTIGPSMAVALLTTFYGAVLANMVFSPLASKLERNSGEELLLNKVYMMGAASISRQENPRRLEMLLNTVLPPAQRVQYFD